MPALSRVRLLILPALSWTLILLGAATEAFCQPTLEAFDGSFRLQTGEVITGGYMVEGGQGFYFYLDTEVVDRGGVFEPVSDIVLRSIGMIGASGIEIEFVADVDGAFNSLVWREPGQEPIRGERIYPHRTRTVHFNSEDGTELHGRLLLPECAGPHPVVVSVHGSGPVNRYGAAFHTVFTRRGGPGLR